jgi:Domain of unknown function (DUF4177)
VKFVIKRQYISLVCALFISSTFLLSYPGTRSDNQTIAYEYKTVKVPITGYLSEAGMQAFNIQLNDMAVDGWELITMTGIACGQWGTSYILAAFKRQKPNKPQLIE